MPQFVFYMLRLQPAHPAGLDSLHFDEFGHRGWRRFLQEALRARNTPE